jgi:hypothetical protein
MRELRSGLHQFSGADPVKIGAPFNPYKVFQGAFAPYWLLEHRGIGAGAKLCYIRLLGFAGKDARCYPSLGKLGTSLGVSERQARDYVKELERAGLVVVEQRGLRRTNVYLFLWTAELEALSNSVPDTPDDPDETSGGTPQSALPDRNDCSGQDRNRASAPDRNSSSGPDRNSPSGPIGINSRGISSSESSSSSAPADLAADRMKKTDSGQSAECARPQSDSARERANRAAQTIIRWAKQRGIQRLRSDRRTGQPEKEHLVEWSEIFERRGVEEASKIIDVLDSALAAADRSGEWRNWAFLTLQIQLAAERLSSGKSYLRAKRCPPQATVEEDPACDWANAKARIRKQVGQIPFMNWFDQTRQLERRASQITIAVSDEASLYFLETEYGDVTRAALADLGIDEVHLVVSDLQRFDNR